jgi:hypothetical protein
MLSDGGIVMTSYNSSNIQACIAYANGTKMISAPLPTSSFTYVNYKEVAGRIVGLMGNGGYQYYGSQKGIFVLDKNVGVLELVPQTIPTRGDFIGDKIPLINNKVISGFTQVSSSGIGSFGFVGLVDQNNTKLVLDNNIVASATTLV